ncbi:MAG: hypothetical protein GY711_11120 [bacterium]|nr:hypothetical protein [bacterium]
MRLSLALLATTSLASAQTVTFSAVDLPTVTRPRFAATADFDLDGLADIAILGETQLRVHFGDGNTGFSESVDIPVLPSPWAIHAADLNADCFPDLIVAHILQNNVSVLLGDGAGGFSALGPFATRPGPHKIDVGDFNADGHLDVVVLCQIHMRLLTGDGSGALAFAGDKAVGSEPSGIAVGDVNADGHLDAVVTKTSAGENVAVLAGDGMGGFTRTACSPGYDAQGVVIGDFRGLGQVNHLARVNAHLRVYTGTGCSALNTDTSVSWLLGAGDVDGDGDLDAVSHEVHLNDGNGFFQQTAPIPGHGGGLLLAVDDLNGDGLVEIVTAAGNTDTVSVIVHWNRSLDWTRSNVNNHFYHIGWPDTWIAGELRAASLGGHLATMRDTAENTSFLALLQNQDVFIGLTDAASEGSFFWTSGEPFVFDNWAFGEPDDAGNSDFVVYDGTSATWRDEPAATELPGLIEVISSDCDGNGFPDATEILLGLVPDLDGDGQPDPCTSPVYCVANVNSTGGAASIAVNGSPDFWRNDLRFTTTGVPPGQFGYYLMSQQTAFVPLFGGSEGNLCLGLPIHRLLADILVADAAGKFQHDFDVRSVPPLAAFAPGQAWNFQCWYRDGGTSNTSDGIAVRFRATPGPRLGFGPGVTVEEETTQVEALVRLDARSVNPVSVSYTVTGTATDLVDFRVDAPNPIVIPVGDICVPFPITVFEDNDPEPAETVIVTLIGPSNARLGEPSTFTLTIANDD